MRNFFNIDNVIFRGISRIGDIFILSFFWVVTSVWIITIGASTTALLTVCIKILRNRDGSLVKDFFGAFKNNFRQSTVIWLIMLVVGLVLYSDMYFWSNMKGIMAMVIGALSAGLSLIYLAVLVFVFAVLAVFENTIANTLKTAFLMAVKNWTTTLSLVLTMGGISYLCWIFPAALFIMLVFGVGIFAMIFSVRYLSVFRRYNNELNPEEEEEANSAEP